MRYLLLVSSLLAIATCQRTPPTTPAQASPFFEFVQHPCRGFCPAYRLTFYTDGRVAYEGLRAVKKMGRDSFQLTATELGRLKGEVQRINLRQYPEQFETTIADAPQSDLIVWDGAGKYKVSGGIERPKPLQALEMLAKDLAEAHGFAVRDGVNPNEPAQSSRREVLVKLKPGLNAGNWIAQFEEIRLVLVRRVSENNNIWVVAYEPGQIKEETLLSMFRQTEGVLEAQGNQAVKERH